MTQLSISKQDVKLSCDTCFAAGHIFELLLPNNEDTLLQHENLSCFSGTSAQPLKIWKRTLFTEVANQQELSPNHAEEWVVVACNSNRHLRPKGR